MGIEPTLSAWKAGVLPLNYTRMVLITIDTYRSWKIQKVQPEYTNLDIPDILTFGVS